MNVSDALKIFEFKTLVKITFHLYQELLIPIEELLSPNQLKCNKQIIGYFKAVGIHLKSIVDTQYQIEINKENHHRK